MSARHPTGTTPLQEHMTSEESNFSEEEIQDIEQQLEAEEPEADAKIIKRLTDIQDNEEISVNERLLHSIVKQIVEVHTNETTEELVEIYGDKFHKATQRAEETFKRLLQKAQSDPRTYTHEGIEYYVEDNVEEKLIYECPKCHETIELPLQKINKDFLSKCNACGWDKGMKPTKAKLRTSKEARNKGKQQDLLKKIHAELDKHHKIDHTQNLATFLIVLTGYLPDDSDHRSAALKGNSSSGKDNCINTVIQHLPEHTAIKRTRITVPAVEDLARKKAL